MIFHVGFVRIDTTGGPEPDAERGRPPCNAPGYCRTYGYVHGCSFLGVELCQGPRELHQELPEPSGSPGFLPLKQVVLVGLANE
jgi:hypothetical protein